MAPRSLPLSSHTLVYQSMIYQASRIVYIRYFIVLLERNTLLLLMSYMHGEQREERG